MSNTLLMRYITLALAEAKLARVPNQLVAADSESGSSNNDKEDEVTAVEDVNEFSGVGSIVGYSAPLGANPDTLGRKKNTRSR